MHHCGCWPIALKLKTKWQQHWNYEHKLTDLQESKSLRKNAFVLLLWGCSTVWDDMFWGNMELLLVCCERFKQEDMLICTRKASSWLHVVCMTNQQAWLQSLWLFIWTTVLPKIYLYTVTDLCQSTASTICLAHVYVVWCSTFCDNAAHTPLHKRCKFVAVLKSGNSHSVSQTDDRQTSAQCSSTPPPPHPRPNVRDIHFEMQLCWLSTDDLSQQAL